MHEQAFSKDGNIDNSIHVQYNLYGINWRYTYNIYGMSNNMTHDIFLANIFMFVY